LSSERPADWPDGASAAGRAETVRNLSWQLLLGKWRSRLGPERWDAMVREVGGPDIRALDGLENVPMEPFNRALLVLDSELGEGDGVLIHEIARASVKGWASMNRGLVKNLQGDPATMLEVFAREVHPFFLNAATASEWIDAGGDQAVLGLDNGLVEPFKTGLLVGFAELTGCKASVEARGRRFVVCWNFRGEPPRPTAVDRFVHAIRAPFLTATIIPVLVGSAVAWAHVGAGFSWRYFSLALVGAVLFHIGTNTANDYFDHRSGADRINPTPGPFNGGSRVIQRGLVRPRTVGAIAASAFVLGSAIGIYLVVTRGVDLLWLGLAGFALAVSYTMPPVSLASRGLGELATALGFGPIMVLGAYYVQAGHYALEPFVASLPIAALIAAVLYINEFPDYLGDKMAGKRTLVVRLGLERARAGYYVLVLGAFASVLVGVGVGVLPAPALLVLLAAPLAWKAHRVFRENYQDPYKLIPANAYTVFLHLGAGALLLAGYMISGLMP
jgi:1,4-dihydroxy-2-naphthoate polyprenyltransferase